MCVDSTDKSRSWGAEQRLEFVEFRLFWDGVINRSDITDRFGVSVPQASNDLTAYRELAPENLEYDPSAKRYFATESFKPRILEPNPDRYLAQLKAIADGIIGIENTWMSTCPDWGVLPLPGRRIDANVLRRLINSIRKGTSLHIRYQSMNSERPDPLWRWITPHALGFDGIRWHTRAFCHRRKDFIDFVVGRCLAVGKTAEPMANGQDDWKWQKTFNVVLEPNPVLTKGQRRAIALDFGMTEEQVTVPVRYALLYYFNKRLRLDVADLLDNPNERPVIISNRSEFDEALKKSMQQATTK